MMEKLFILPFLRHHLFTTALRIINRSVKQAAFLFLFSLMAFGTQAQVVQQIQNFKGLESAISVAVSPDNNHVYAVGQIDDAIVVFSRNTGTGALTFVQTLQDGVGGVDGLNSPRSVTVSPDNNHVYVVGYTDDAIAVFSRNTTTGVLTFVEMQKDGVGGVDGLDGARSVTVSPDNNHVYATGSEAAIAVFSRNTTTGALTFVEIQKDGVGGVDGLSGVRSVIVSPDNGHVYASGEYDDAIAVFSRNTGTGALTFVEIQKDGVGGVDGLSGAVSVTVSPDNNHVYASGESDNAIAVFSRNTTTGALTFVEMQKDGVSGVDGLRDAISVTVSPDNNHVYATGYSDDAIAVFSRNTTTGALTFVEMLKNGVGSVDRLDGAWGVVVSPDNNHLYATGYNDDAITAFSRNTGTGVLTFVEYISNTGATNPSSNNAIRGLEGVRSAAVSPDNNHLYAVGDDDAIAVFSRNTGTGALTFVEVQKDGVGGVDGLNNARSVTVSPDNNHVYVASSSDHAIAVFSRNTGTGALTFVEIQKDGVGGVDGLSGAHSVTVSPDNNHVYVASSSDHAIAVFSRNTGTGALTFVEMQKDGVGGVDGLRDAISVTVSPDNNYVYAAGFNDNAIAVFSRNTGTGALTFVEMQKDGVSGVDGLYRVRSVIVSPDNNHLYASSQNDDAIAVFSRNTTTGALTFVEIQKDGVGGVDGLDASYSVTVSPNNNRVYAAGFNDDAIAVFSRNTTTGTLTYIQQQKNETNGVMYLDGAISVAVSPDNHFVYALGNNDDGIVVFQSGLLPVELTYFTGQATTAGNLLQWQTAWEENNAGFEIERSTNGKDWQSLDFVQGNGTTLEVQNYDYTDTKPMEGVNYYRLKQVDFDGEFEYSDIVHVTVKSLKTSTTRIFPNPVQDALTIIDGQGQATIYNALGQPVKELIINKEQLTINISNLPKGQYILRISQEDGTMISQQFFKHH